MQIYIEKLLPYVIAVVTLIKKLFPQLQGNVVIAVSLIVGGIIGGGFDLLTNNPIETSLAVILGIIAGGVAAGLWGAASSIAKKIGNSK